MLNYIDNGFVETWEHKYDETENDECEYQKLLIQVRQEISSFNTLSQETFRRIIDWKSPRVKGKINWANLEEYFEIIHQCLQFPEDHKITLLTSLYGIGAPVASTILHFIYPFTFPIFDRRTVDVLLHYELIQHKSTGVNQYPAFREAILRIQRNCPDWNLRQIDRALFAFHKNNPSIFGTLSQPKKKCC